MDVAVSPDGGAIAVATANGVSMLAPALTICHPGCGRGAPPEREIGFQNGGPPSEASGLRIPLALSSDRRRIRALGPSYRFHAGPSIACASCHPEGTDDGRTWTFTGIGPRRTQSLRGGVMRTAPFHWDGDVPSFNALVNAELAAWIDALPALPAPAPRDVEAATRGAVVFERAWCSGCHAAEELAGGAVRPPFAIASAHVAATSTETPRP
jgi:hypothetical protein